MKNEYGGKDDGDWKNSVATLLNDQLNTMINCPGEKASQAAAIDPAWERRLKTLLAIMPQGSKLRTKADKGVFSHRLKDLLVRLESCVTVSQFNVSEKVLAEELKNHHPYANIYNVYLFHYVSTHFPHLLEAEDGASYLEGSFGGSVISGAAKYDRRIVPEFFRALGQVSADSAVIGYIREAFFEVKDKVGFVRGLKELNQGVRLSVLLQKGNETVAFLQQFEVAIHTSFDDYISCLQHALDLGPKVGPLNVSSIHAAWRNKCAYWQEKRRGVRKRWLGASCCGSRDFRLCRDGCKILFKVKA